MNLGRFSVSLAVKDLTASREFYEKLGFAVVDGEADQNWLIMEQGTTLIGLFQEMFENNILTFNPTKTDVRVLQQHLKDAGIDLISEVETDAGIGHFTLVDPDGNAILVDQHVEETKPD